MRKLITLSLAVLMVGLFAAVVYAAVQSGDDATSTTGTTETTDTTTTTTTDDREPGDDRREDRREDRRDDRGADDRGADDRFDDRGGDPPAPGAVDVSGPCDEAEHANDPRCTGVTPRVEDDARHADDRVGHDVGDDHGGDRDRGDFEDHSGPGRGGSDDDSGHGGSGSGHGGGGDDNSGHGGSGRDHEEDD
jgi:hypothetical protein